MQRNVGSQKWIVFAFDETDNTPKTGDAGQITAEISADGGAGGGNITDTNPTELEDGYYAFDVTQGETNADLLLILPESTTPNIQVIGVPGSVYTTEPNRNKLSVDSNGRTDVIKVAGTTQSANDNSADINAILVDTGTTLEDRQVTIAVDVAGLDGNAMVGTNSAALASVLGAAVGVSISADIAAVKAETGTIVTDTNEIQGKLPATKFMGSSDGADDDGTLNTIATDTTTGIPALIATAQSDLDIITGASGVVIQDGTITAAKLGANCITNAKIADDAIGAENLATDAISADALAADAITAIWAKAMSDLAAIPAYDASALDALNILFMALRNKQTATSSAQTIANNAGATIATASLADAAGTTTKEEYA